MTETELIPGAVRLGKWKAIWNIREGWKGAAEYTNIVPELFDLWNDPGERYDRFMNGWAEKTWQAPQMGAARAQPAADLPAVPEPAAADAPGSAAPCSTPRTPRSNSRCNRLMHAIAGNK